MLILQELELVEDVWRGEAQDLLTQIAQLQEDNKQLMTNLANRDVNFSKEEFQKHEGKCGGKRREVPEHALSALDHKRSK